MSQYRKSIKDLAPAFWAKGADREWSARMSAALDAAIVLYAPALEDLISLAESAHTGGWVFPMLVPPWSPAAVEVRLPGGPGSVWLVMFLPVKSAHAYVYLPDSNTLALAGIQEFQIGENGDGTPAGWWAPEYQTQAAADEAWGAIIAASLSVSLCHFKGSGLMEHRPPAQLSKKHEKKTGRPLVRYHTLDIGVPRAVIAQAMKREGCSAQEAVRLHVVRGHYRGLDRSAGRFWVRPHLRGSAERGEVVKNYAVEPPDAAP